MPIDPVAFVGILALVRKDGYCGEEEGCEDGTGSAVNEELVHR